MLDFIKRHLTWFLLGITLIVGSILTSIILTRREDRGVTPMKCGEEQAEWSRAELPIRLVMNKSSMEGWAPAVAFSIQYWNKAVGFDIFNPTLGIIEDNACGELSQARCAKHPICDPVVVIAEVPGQDHGETRLCWDKACVIGRAEVGMPSAVFDDELKRRVAAHELGHVLGLDHDDDEDSVMYPAATTLFGWEVSQKDVDLIKETYGDYTKVEVYPPN